MSDMEKIEYLRINHSDNPAVTVFLARYELAVKDANYWHIEAAKNPTNDSVQELYYNKATRFRMASQILDDIYMAMTE